LSLQAELINPFLTSSIQVIETIIQVRPKIGTLRIQQIHYSHDCVWLKIRIYGQVEKDILFGFPEIAAKNIVSMMLGGYAVHELDDMCRSAVAELGNMISGNASTLLYSNGISVEITPPSILTGDAFEWGKSAVTIPLEVERLGGFDINIIV